MAEQTLTPVPAGAVEAVASHLHPPGSYEPADHEVPTAREEIWRFTPMRRLRGVHDDADLSGHSYEIDVKVDPAVTAELTSSDDPAKGSSGYVPSDRVSARAWKHADGLFKIVVPKEAVIEQPSIVTIRGTDVEKAAASHVVVHAEPYSQATVVVRYEGSATWVDNVEIVLGEGAHLTFVSVHDWDDDAVQLSHQHSHVGRDATLKHVVVAFGGELVRINASVDYDGPGGDVDMLGLYFADSDQHLEHRLFVDQNAPRTRSNVDYRGALQGKGASAVWIGDVLIRKAAEGIQTYESNRNLVLTDGCRAISVPNLEIETGDIEGAGHASTTGRFDDLQLFYLQSRGIPEDEARRLVVHGFFADIIKRIGVRQIEEDLLAAVESELERSAGLAPASAVGASPS
ncbi:MAG TPA: Fe-S cluster assembly protein SufD [Nocardioidaceae bacterium]|nr:Fe-S cluster assembly protein SufD [Nocardioidaceae bacterium]